MKEARYRANRSPMAHRDTAANRARGESLGEREREREKKRSRAEISYGPLVAGSAVFARPTGGPTGPIVRRQARALCVRARALFELFIPTTPTLARACSLFLYGPFSLSFHARARLLVRFQASFLSFLSLVLLGPPYPLLQREERDRDVSST